MCKEKEEHNFWQPAISFAMLIGGIIISHFKPCWFTPQWIEVTWYLIAFMPVGLGVIKEAIEYALKGEFFSEFMLMSVASIGAFIIGDFPEAVAVMLFYFIGETLQDMAVDKAKDNIRSLVAFRPDKARVVTDEGTTVLPPETVKKGEIIEVNTGERVPLDGILIGNGASFNTAALTGESIPRFIDAGKEVLAGMIVTDSIVRINVTKTADDSAISRILNMVETAAERKAPAELFIRKFARIYTPIVILLSLLTVILPFAWSFVCNSFTFIPSVWIYRALIFLVISCPCALVISIPLSYFGGIGAASVKGLLFKGSNYLDAIRGIDTVVFDKTGTLTKGSFSVTKTEEAGNDNMLAIVAAMEKGSSHPIAKAITDYVGDNNMIVEDVKETAGYGISARHNNDFWIAGTLRMLKKEGIAYPSRLKNCPETLVACAKNGQYAGYIMLDDTLKDDASLAVDRLRSLGIKRIIMLSGDKQALADKISGTLHLDGSYGDLLPEDKVSHIETLKNNGYKVAFVGDGINDAPVLAMSDVGIAMGTLGSDMAIETADIVIHADRPSKVADAISIGRSTHNIASQNIIFSISVKVAVMILGIFGIANLWGAVFADVGVALIAVVNAMRVFLSARNGRKDALQAWTAE
ncbi:MAG: heavy metal translocating P-type ATPase [Prevotella sp.]